MTEEPSRSAIHGDGESTTLRTASPSAQVVHDAGHLLEILFGWEGKSTRFVTPSVYTLGVMTKRDNLRCGRESYSRRAWSEAYRLLSLADQAAPLRADDLEMLANAACLSGRDAEYVLLLGRAHHVKLDDGEDVGAARCAFWLGLTLMLQGNLGPASGWLSRASRLLEGVGGDCAERGYLLLPVAERHLAAGDAGMAHSASAGAAEIGNRFQDRDLIACARHVQGRALLLQRKVEEGLALLDEAMVAVTEGELSPIMTGLIYCSVIDACHQVYALDRAREWTAALARWCDEQPEMVAFAGLCRVHRAEIMQMHGAWPEALEEARHACERSLGNNRQAMAASLNRQAEVHRLRGEFSAAEEAYRGASRSGAEPQPGLALLRLAQGRIEEGAAAIGRTLGGMTDPLQRTRLLPACIEIMLAKGELQHASDACSELENIAQGFDRPVLRAMAAEARGAVELAQGHERQALEFLSRAGREWQQIEAPYQLARVRVLAGLACRALGDDDGAALEIAAARTVFRKLQAIPDLARLDALVQRPAPGRRGILTSRELQVLRLVSTGKTNKAIAAELSLSRKTVDRHLSNILTKLDVHSRAGATAYAYRHKLI